MHGSSSTVQLVCWLRREKKDSASPSRKETDDTRGTEDLAFTVTNPGPSGGSSTTKKVDVPIVNEDPD